MDERTRTTDEDLAPRLRRTFPEPDTKTRPRSKTRLVVGLIVVLLAAFGAYEFYQTRKSAAPAAGRFPPGAVQSVGAATIGLGNIRVIINALGTVTPLATVTVQTQINGYLTAVGYTEGQMVKKGDFLAQIDDRPYQVMKEQFEGQLARDQALLEQAQMDLKRYELLTAQNSIARQQADDQAFLVKQDQGIVKLDQAQIDAQALNIAYCHIVSPVTGRVGLRLVDPGNYVQTTSTTGLAVVTQLQPITVIFTVPEDDLPLIMPAFNAGTALQVTAFDRANIHQLGVGKVAAIDNQIDTTTGTVKIRAQFDNADDALFPNQFVNAALLVKTLENVVTVPTAAIQRGAPGSTPGGAMGSYVFVINADDSVSVRAITTANTDGSMTAVESGLTAGERVVVDGLDRLRDGTRVRIASLDGKPVAGPGAGGASAGAPGAPGAAGPRRERGQNAPGENSPGQSAPGQNAPGQNAGGAANRQSGSAP